jgi:hypothetical protein
MCEHVEGFFFFFLGGGGGGGGGVGSFMKQLTFIGLQIMLY